MGFKLNIKNFCAKCEILGRDGNPINIFARRFRRTIATRLVEQGASPEIVAAFLDHADIQQVEVYFEFHKHRKQHRLEEAAGPFFKTLNDSIRGKFIANATEARNPKLVQPFFDEETQDFFGVANCGRDIEKIPVCNESQIAACYGCSYFQPYLSDVHSRVLVKLERRKENLVNLQGHNRGRIIDGIDRLINDVKPIVEAVNEIQSTQNQS